MKFSCLKQLEKIVVSRWDGGMEVSFVYRKTGCSLHFCSCGRKNGVKKGKQ